MVKVKAHRGAPANEEADIQADKAISGKDVRKALEFSATHC